MRAELARSMATARRAWSALRTAGGSLICVPTTVWLITARTENGNKETLQNESQLRATGRNNSLSCNDPVEKSPPLEDHGNADNVLLCWIHFLVRLIVPIKKG